MLAFALSPSYPSLRLTSTAISTNPFPRPSPTLLPRHALSSVASLYLPPNPKGPKLKRFCLPPPPLPPSSSSGRHRDDGEEHPQSSSFLLLAQLSRMSQRYNAMIADYPLKTKALSSAFLVFLSDLFAQALTSTTPDLLRLVRHAVYGLVFVGPMGHFWFVALAQIVRTGGIVGVVSKVFLDQALFTPFNIALFLMVMKIAEGTPRRDAQRFLKRSLRPTLYVAWRVWPLVMALNFSVVPQPYQLLFANVVSVFWVAFLSAVANEKKESREEVTADAACQ